MLLQTVCTKLEFSAFSYGFSDLTIRNNLHFLCKICIRQRDDKTQDYVLVLASNNVANIKVKYFVVLVLFLNLRLCIATYLFTYA